MEKPIIIELPKISRTLFTYETYGVKMGITWPVCYHFENKTYVPLEHWIVLGYCTDPSLSSCAGGKRPFAVMYELQKDIKKDIWGDDLHKAGLKAWYHYKTLPVFTSLVGDR